MPEKLEEIFSKFAKKDKTELYFVELSALVNGNRNTYDPFGLAAQMLEWGITFILIKDENGPSVYKEQIRGVCDGSLFEIIAKQREVINEIKEKSI